jgi:branched-chain amino acid transport system permease protein
MGRAMTAPVASNLLSWHKIRPAESLFWMLAVAAFFAFPNDLPLGTQVLTMALFVVALDLALGFAGILSLGHALFFGTGAYLAAFISLGGWHEPISGALLAGFAAGLLALALGPLVVFYNGLPQIMVTLLVMLIGYEAANKATWLTGGDDGLGGFELDPLLGIFRWSVYGQTAYLYALVWLFVIFALARRLIASPFGVALQGFRENRNRMLLIGAPVKWHLIRVYAVSGFFAGIAGAVSAQTAKFVSLNSLSLNLSVDVLVMLVLGGVGRLYGALLGATVYTLVHHFAAEWNPYHWMFVIGGLLVFVVRFARGGILGVLEAVYSRVLAQFRARAG